MKLKVGLFALFLFAMNGCGPQRSSGPIEEIDPNRNPHVLYGADNRLDYYQVTDPSLRALADSTVALVESKNITSIAGLSEIKGETFGNSLSLCSSEPFRDQPTGAFCSGSLVGPDLVITAGHCIPDANACASTRFVFGYAVKQAGALPKQVQTSEIYACAQVLHSQQPGQGADYAVIRLNRPVTNHSPLQVRRAGGPNPNDSVFVIGHPVGLPVKIAGGAQIRKVVGSDYFVANLDTYGGNSGSAVFSEQTKLIEGILVRGENDFVWSGNCQVSNRCADGSCRGEDVTLISNVLSLVPPSNSQTQPVLDPDPVTPPGREEFKSTVALSIPDNSPAGITGTIQVPSEPKGRRVLIGVQITHTWKGDLTLELVAPDGTKRILHNRTGGNARNISGIYGESLTSAEDLSVLSSVNRSGTWSLKVVDSAKADVGTLNSWSIIFK